MNLIKHIILQYDFSIELCQTLFIVGTHIGYVTFQSTLGGLRLHLPDS